MCIVLSLILLGCGILALLYVLCWDERRDEWDDDDEAGGG